MNHGWVALLYHNVTPESPQGSGGPEHFSVTTRAFRQQLNEIRRRGMQGCSIEDAVARGGSGRIAISFDDGDVGQFEQAFPALVELGMTATFFITTAWVGRSGYVTWEQLGEMKRAGMSIQSHTCTHPFLSELDEGALRDELRESKLELNRRLGQETTSIAFPGGDAPRAHLAHVLVELEYRVVGTSRWGTNSVPRLVQGPLYVSRCTVRGEPSMAHFRRVLAGNRWVGMNRGLREAALRSLRSSLGPSRYARWRTRFLSTVAR